MSFYFNKNIILFSSFSYKSEILNIVREESVHCTGNLIYKERFYIFFHIYSRSSKETREETSKT